MSRMTNGLSRRLVSDDSFGKELWDALKEHEDILEKHGIGSLEELDDALRALSVIRNKRELWLDFLRKTKTVEEFNRALLAYYDFDDVTCKEFYLSKEEFDLLKRTLPYKGKK